MKESITAAVRRAVVVIDDLTLAREAIRGALDATDDLAVAYETGDLASLETIQLEDVQAVVIGGHLVAGGDTLRRLQRLFPQARIVVTGLKTADTWQLRLLREGASGLLSLSASGHEVVDALRGVLVGRTHLDTSFTNRLVNEVAAGHSIEGHDRLSGHERQVFLGIAGGKSLKKISVELSIGLSTVSTYRSRVLKKIAVRTNAELAAYAIRHGLL